MAGLSDSITIGILLLLIFGAVSFYLYSRMSQTEKRLGLLENLLLTLKLSTEASLMGPDSVEPISSPAPLNPEDVDDVHEEDYAAMLKATSSHAAPVKSEEADAEELLRSMNIEKKTSVDVNYESMSAKELKALVKERNLTGDPEKKREIIAFLKNNGVRVSSEEAAPQPLPTQPGDLDGGFSVELENGL